VAVGLSLNVDWSNYLLSLVLHDDWLTHCVLSLGPTQPSTLRGRKMNNKLITNELWGEGLG